MKQTTEYPVQLSVRIPPQSIKRIVEEKRLLEFAEAFSSLAAAQLKVQLVEELARAGTGLATAGQGVQIDLGFLADDPYGTPPKPWPWPEVLAGKFLEDIRTIVHEEVVAVH